MIDAKNMAAYIIEKSKEKKFNLDHLKLQKLLYFIALEWIRKFEKYPYQQKIEMWKLGPVIADVYSDYRTSGSSKITKVATTLAFTSDGGFKIKEIEPSNLSEIEEETVSNALTKYSNLGSFELVNLTHTHKPWKDNEDKILNRVEKICYNDNDYNTIIRENLS